MNALHNRTHHGGSYCVSVSLNQFNQFYISLGTLEPVLQSLLRSQHSQLALRHYDDMISLVGKTIRTLVKSTPRLFNPQHFQVIDARLGGQPGEKMAFVGSAAVFETSKLGYDVGSCFLGADKAEWPES